MGDLSRRVGINRVLMDLSYYKVPCALFAHLFFFFCFLTLSSSFFNYHQITNKLVVFQSVFPFCILGSASDTHFTSSASINYRSFISLSLKFCFTFLQFVWNLGLNQNILSKFLYFFSIKIIISL